MAVGPSGRVVVEIDPELKKELYGCLGTDGMSLRDWFLDSARQYLSRRSQLSLELHAVSASVQDADV